MPRKEAVAPVTMMLPPPFSTIAGVQHWAQVSSPSTFVFIAMSNCSTVISSKRFHTPLPALYNNVSTGPSCAAMDFIVVVSAALSVMSHGNAALLGICVVAVSSFDAVRLTSATA